jgi:hypothetical protein
MRAKFIYEKFTEDSDPIEDMGIGQIHRIKKWLKQYGITDYKINKNFSINVVNGVDLRNRNLYKLPDYIQFNRVGNFFDVFNNHLTTMRGFPRIIHGSPNNYRGNFWCSYNNLTSLKYFPKIIEGNVFIDNNKKQFTVEEILKVCKVGKNIKWFKKHPENYINV